MKTLLILVSLNGTLTLTYYILIIIFIRLFAKNAKYFVFLFWLFEFSALFYKSTQFHHTPLLMHFDPR